MRSREENRSVLKSSLKTKDNEIKNLEELFRQFIRRWNELVRRGGPPLEDRCNNLGFLEEINEGYSEAYHLIHFLPDRANAQNVPGFKALSFLRR